jgi:hypothetical protein
MLYLPGSLGAVAARLTAQAAAGQPPAFIMATAKALCFTPLDARRTIARIAQWYFIADRRLWITDIALAKSAILEQDI